MDKPEEIKGALYELYGILKDVSTTASGKRMLAPEIVDKLSYRKDEVKKVLEIKTSETCKLNSKGVTTKSQELGRISARISEIKDSDGVRKLYNEEIIKLFDPSVEKGMQAKIDKRLTANDLKYLYGLISSVGVRGKRTKKDLFQMFKDYYDDEVRTTDLNRKLMGK